jgi:hypothetical protein
VLCTADREFGAQAALALDGTSLDPQSPVATVDRKSGVRFRQWPARVALLPLSASIVYWHMTASRLVVRSMNFSSDR